MAQNNSNGLFGGPTVDDLYAAKRAQNRKSVREAGADSAAMGGNFYANLQAKANEQLGQAASGVVGGLLQGTALAPPEDPAFAKAEKREADRIKFGKMFKDLKMDSADDYYKMAQALRGDGYMEQADKLVAQGHGFNSESRENRKVDITKNRLDLDTTVAGNKNTLANQKEKFFQTATTRGLDQADVKQAWATVLGKHGMKNTDKLTALQGTKLAQDLSIATTRISVTKMLGLKKASVDEINAATNKFNANVGQAYGLAEQSRKSMSANASIKHAEASLALKEKLGLSADANDKVRLGQARARINLEADRDQFGKFLGLEKFAQDKLSDNRLYTLAHNKQSFDQVLAERNMDSKEYLASHKVTMDGKVFDFSVLDKGRTYELAKSDSVFRQHIGSENLSLAKTDQAHKKYATDNNIRLQDTKIGNDKEATRINQELLRDQHTWRMENDTAKLKQSEIEALADKQLRQSSLELQERGIDIKNMTAQARISLATKEHAFNKFLGLAGLDNADQDRKLTIELAGRADAFKQAGLDLETASLHQKKQLYMADLKMKGAIAKVKANATTPRSQKTFSEADHNILTDILKNNTNWDKIKDKYPNEEYTTGLASVDADTQRAIGDQLSAIMAKDKTMNIQKAFEIFAGGPTPSDTSSGGGDPYATVGKTP